jgi:RNase adaptor protein for sRNA GlmZ degradation
MRLVIVGGASPEHVEEALTVFEQAGYAVLRGGTVETGGGDGDVAFGLAGPGAEALREADRRQLRYVLVHSGPDDGEVDGTYARAHHRVQPPDVQELATRLRGRASMELTCLAFAFKNGIPAESAWVVDARCLENPYWVPDLKPLDGRDPRVRDYVLSQPSAGCLLDGLEATLVPLLAEYRKRGRMELTVAFGCTGGRHRSVVLAEEMARRLSTLPDLEVAFRARDLQA